ncbi:MAG: histidine kinase [Flammeovirgaceae bacterium]|nr:histidine kinase [Flammeovirgaceae bacterium]
MNFIKVYQSGVSYHWEGMINYPISFYLSLWVLSHLLLSLYLSTRELRRKLFVLIHIVASLFFGIINKIQAGVFGILLERLFLSKETFSFTELLIHWQFTYLDFIEGSGYYWLFLLVLLALDYFARYHNQQNWSFELESKLINSQLHTLRMQMKPHFLFNALNTISMMIRRNENRQAVTMVSALSDLLRNSLAKDTKPFVSLSEELDLVKKYLEIESIRFQDRLNLDFNIEEETLDCKVPNLLLQPIVENAFKHGVAKSIDNAILKISATRENGEISLKVFNTGPSLPPDWNISASTGIGITNTTNRLRQLYAGKFKFMVSENDGGFLVNIILPYKKI